MDGQRNTLSNKAPQVFSLNINKGNGTSIARQRSAPVARPSQVTTKNMDKGNGINIPRQISAPPTVPSQVILPPQAYKGKKKLGDEYSKGQCRWDATMVENLVEVMLDIVTTFGKRADNGNRREAYPLAAEEMNKRGFLVTKDHVINKLRQMKKEYNVASETRKKSGFEFDHELKVIKADSNAWAKWVKERPEARMLRTKWLQYYDECAVIFGSDYATGDGQYVASDSRSETENCEGEFDVDITNVDDSEVQIAAPQTSTNVETSKGESRKTAPTTNKRKRSRFSNDDPALLIFQKMVDVSTSIAESLVRPSMKTLNEALKAVPNLSKKHARKAYNMLGKDTQLAEMFFGCDEEERKEWVLEILGVEEAEGESV